MAITDNKKSSLKTLFFSSNYHVPKYQRGYSWTKNELEDFWSDLSQLVEDPDLSNHFIGLVVAHAEDENDDVKYIIDGQQRLSTSVILLDSLRKALKTIEDEYHHQDAEHYISEITNLIGKISSREKLNSPRIP